MTSPSSRDIDSAHGVPDAGCEAKSASQLDDGGCVSASTVGTKRGVLPARSESRVGGTARCESALSIPRCTASLELSTCAAARESLDEQARLPMWRRPHRWITVPAGLAL